MAYTNAAWMTDTGALEAALQGNSEQQALLEQRQAAEHAVVHRLYCYCCCCVCVVVPLLLFFSIYALYVSDTDGIRSACGRPLWDFVLVHLVLAACVGCIVFVVLNVLIACLHNECMVGACSLFLFFAYSAVMVGMGASIVTDATHKPPCMLALGAVNTLAGGTPLLAIMGIILLAVDGLILLALTCMCMVGVCAECILCMQKSSNEPEF
jgi:hypothetical protein